MSLPPDVAAALATLQARWGGAAPRLGEATRPTSPVGDVVGALATVPLPSEREEHPDARPVEGVVSTGFRALDAILGPGGLPRATSLALRGDGSSGKTTLALRLVAEAQAAGSIAAWIDIGRAFDPVEAVARGVQPAWLIVVTPDDLDEGLAIAATLTNGRAVDLLVIDLPSRPPKPALSRVANRLHRLVALARRTDTLLVLLEPPSPPRAVGTAVAESAGLRLELARRAWIRLGRDVVGQRTEVVVARNRFGPPGRRAGLRILYADGDERDACLVRDDLLIETPSDAPIPVPGKVRNATAPPVVAPSPPGSRPLAALDRPASGGTVGLRLITDGTDRRRRPAVDRRDRPGRGPAGPSPGGATGDPARDRSPARA